VPKDPRPEVATEQGPFIDIPSTRPGIIDPFQ